MKSLYVIVHEHYIRDQLDVLRARNGELGRIPSILDEITRIKKEERWVEVAGTENPFTVRYPLDGVKSALVCGAYGEMSVRDHGKALQNRGVSVEYHDAGILFARRDLLMDLPRVDMCSIEFYE